jgi:hypothetical protein
MLINKKYCVPNNAMVEVKNTAQNECYVGAIQRLGEKSSNNHDVKSQTRR